MPAARFVSGRSSTTRRATNNANEARRGRLCAVLVNLYRHPLRTSSLRVRGGVAIVITYYANQIQAGVQLPGIWGA
jgi:hypothetical protein